MAEGLLIPCPHCDTLNRVPPPRLADGGKCGKCAKPLFVGQPLELDARRFDVHVRSTDLPLLVDFWAPWCAPCRMMAPTFAAVAKEFEPRLRLAKVNTEEHRDLGTRFGIASIPTLVLFWAGTEVARRSGAPPASELRRWIESQLVSALA
jgi:thioredoxin 2